MPRIAWLVPAAVLALVSGAASAAKPVTPALVLVATGLPGAVFAAPAPSGRPDRLYVVQRTGLVRILDHARVLDPPFLDLRDRLSGGGLRGLFSLAFDPGYAENGRFFVNYVGRDGDVYVSQFTAVHGVGARSSERVLLRVATPRKDPFAHYGGQVAFGPDGQLYASFGDDATADAAQDADTLLGKLVRIDVRAKMPQPQVVAIGLRNPWRLSFDPVSRDLYIGDVGDTRREEIDRLPPGFRGVANFGWPYFEGSLPTQKAPQQLAGRVLAPFAEYRHVRGRCNSVTGGYVYRGSALPSLRGRYMYGDLCGGVWSVPANGRSGSIRRAEPIAPPGLLTSFAEGADHTFYLITLEGRVYEVAAAPVR